MGGLTQARKIAALAEAHGVPVIPHAGQMHNYHVVMASLNSPMAEYFPIVDVEVGQRAVLVPLRRRAQGRRTASWTWTKACPGLGLTVNERALEKFDVVE